jgi:HEAT repeat protein
MNAQTDVLALLRQVASFGPVNSYDRYQQYRDTVYPLRQQVEQMGLAALPDLLRALDDEDGKLRALAAEIVGVIGDPQAVSPLQAHLKAEETRLAAVTKPVERVQQREVIDHLRIALIRLRDQATLNHVIHQIRLGNEQERRQASRFLSEAGPEGLAYVIAQAQNDPSPVNRKQAIFRLSVNENDPALLNVYYAALRDAAPDVRAAALHALGKSKAADPRTRPILVNALNDSSEEVRVTAIHTLAPMLDPDLAAHLVAALNDSSPFVVTTALDVLFRYITIKGEWKPDSIQPLLACAHPERLSNPAASLRHIALILGEIGDPAAIPTLIELAGYEGNQGDERQNPEHPATVVFPAITRFGFAIAAPYLRPLLKDEKITTRINTITAFELLGDSKAAEWLKLVQPTEPDQAVQQAIQQAIHQLKK